MLRTSTNVYTDHHQHYTQQLAEKHVNKNTKNETGAKKGKRHLSPLVNPKFKLIHVR